MTLTFDTADRLLDRLESEDDPTGVVANELLRHFFRGYSVQKLRPLLHSEDVAQLATRNAMFPASRRCATRRALPPPALPPGRQASSPPTPSRSSRCRAARRRWRAGPGCRPPGRVRGRAPRGARG